MSYAEANQTAVEKQRANGMSSKPKEEEKEMSFLDHLEELRWHIIRSLVAIVGVGIIMFIFHKFLFDYVILGPTHDNFISYQWFCNLSNYFGLGETMCMTAPELVPIATGLAETFIASVKVSFIGGFLIAFPYVFYELWNFIRPGLYDEERKATRGVVAICSFLFLLGVCFGYFIIAPFAVNFLGGYEIPGVTNTPTLKSFMGYMVMFTFPAGLIFQLPILVYFLSKFGLVTAETMRKYRKHSIIGILVLASILTPPDVVTQFLIGIPLYILYEVSILIAARVKEEIDRPEPKIGFYDYEEYIKENLKYPAEAKAKKIEGMVTLQFLVKKNGRLSEFKIIEGLGNGCDKEAIRLLKSGVRWRIPKGKKQQTTQYRVPFKLSPEDESSMTNILKDWEKNNLKNSRKRE